jgi:hypothetical protein
MLYKLFMIRVDSAQVLQAFFAHTTVVERFSSSAIIYQNQLRPLGTLRKSLLS